uniref:Macaca fascicularis brain cDNA, clone: QbsA-10785 n=1 Tax=Macaca fascicularis TaxID=9541 RepID=I7GLM2_MACFA|nr:unnamed protein product [Macaca fascicularis]
MRSASVSHTICVNLKLVLAMLVEEAVITFKIRPLTSLIFNISCFYLSHYSFKCWS